MMGRRKIEVVDNPEYLEGILDNNAVRGWQAVYDPVKERVVIVVDYWESDDGS